VIKNLRQAELDDDFRLVQNWMSLPLCDETFLSKRGEKFKGFKEKHF